MRTTTSRILAALCLTGLVVAVAPVASSHEGNNHGTIKVHDDEVVSPATKNEPQVSCDFWIEGFNMADDSGWIEISSIPPTTNPPVMVYNQTWSGVAEVSGGGFHFNKGAINLAPGHYKAEAFLDQGSPSNQLHKSKSKVFWVNECNPEGKVPPCPPSVTATARGDESILVDWGAVANATEYRVYRAVGSGDFDGIDQVLAPTTEYLDTNTTVGTTYRYYVTAVVEGVESEGCPVVEATAIPFFPGAVGIGLAAVATLGTMFWMRRK